MTLQRGTLQAPLVWAATRPTIRSMCAGAYGAWPKPSISWNAAPSMCEASDLAVDGAVDLAHDGVDPGEEIVGRVAAQVGHVGFEETEGVTQFLGRGAEGGIDVAVGEAMDQEGVDDAGGHGQVERIAQVAGGGDAAFEHLADDAGIDAHDDPARAVDG